MGCGYKLQSLRIAVEGTLPPPPVLLDETTYVTVGLKTLANPLAAANAEAEYQADPQTLDDGAMERPTPFR
jgi:hypothetical protein